MLCRDVSKKIVGPTLSLYTFHREAHITKLGEVIVGTNGSARYKLVMLCAPAGYGKTTLLADVAQHLNLRCCWYMLDETDADKITLLRFLVLSIRHQFPGFGSMLDALLANARTDQLENFIDALVAAIRTEISEDFVLFLCNYHAVNASKGVNALTNQLLERLPSRCVLVIESRAVPMLDFVPLFVHNEVIEFDHAFFHFTPAEILALADREGLPPLKEKVAEQLATLFGGWITGILLGTHLGDTRILTTYRDMYTPPGLTDVQLDRQNLFAYIVNEVFGRDPGIYAFLKDIAILEKISPAFCNTLLEINDAAERLQYLEQQGLFVTKCSDGSQATYICHPVLRELLCDQAQHESPERFLALHRRAQELYHMAQDFEMAIHHALAARLDEQAARLILKIHEQMFSQGHMETLARWIDALSASTTARYPELLVVRANIYLLLGEYTQADALLTRASESISITAVALDADKAFLLEAKISIARGSVLLYTGKDTEAQHVYQQILECVPADKFDLRAEIYTCLGECTNTQGEYTLGIAHFQKALQLWGRGHETYQTVTLHDMLARTYSLLSNFTLAEHHLSCAARYWKHLSNGWGRVNNLLNMGMVKQRQGKTEAAENCFQEALHMSRGPLNFRRGEAYALANLGLLYQEQERYPQSLAVTEEGLTLGYQLRDNYLIYWTLCTLAMTYLLMDDTETATLFISEAKLTPVATGGASFEKAFYDLTRGMILLRQLQYTEASAYFSALASQLHTTSLRGERLQATLRLVECLLAQEQRSEALQQLDAVAQLLSTSHNGQIAQRELRLLPALEQAIKTLPELAKLQLMLQPESAADEKGMQPQPPLATAPAPLIASTTGSLVTRKAQIKILALGEPAVLIDNKLVTRWRMGRAMELLFWLLDHGRPLHREQIIGTFWPESDESLNQTLNSTVYYLRKVLGEACIVSDGHSYKLDLPALYGDEVWYDVQVFQEYYAKARKSISNKDDITARVELSAMVDLYQGNYVQSIYSDWCLFQRDKLRVAYLDARQHLARIAWESEQFDESILHWQQILAVDSCLEDAHYGLMRCYIRQSKRGLALRQYQSCVALLRDGLAIEPGSALRNLYQQLRESS